MNKKNIIITGGFGRIGYALLNYFSKIKHNIIFTDVVKPKRKIVLNDNVSFIKLDLTKEKNIKKLISFSKKKLKKIDAVIHCSYPKTQNWGVDLLSLDQKSLNINLNNNIGASIILAKEVIKIFNKQKKGSLIFFSSIYGFAAPKFNDYEKNKIYSPVEYGVMKSGIISMVRYLAKKNQKKGFRINCISPGGIEDDQNLKFKKNYNKHCNFKGLLAPEDLNSITSFLINDDSKYINGQNIIVDDGWSL
jgi:NAD(P)-dependent dehydrogenase (short-subunit alcohol dehydrogenase family)